MSAICAGAALPMTTAACDLDRLAAFLALVHDGGGTACAVEQNAAHRAAQEQFAAGCLECPRKCIAQALRAALDIAAAASEVAALRHREQHPPQRVGVVVPVEHVGGERTLCGLVRAEGPVAVARRATAPARQQGAELQQRRQALERPVEGSAALAQCAKTFEMPSISRSSVPDPGALCWKAVDQSLACLIGAFRQDEGDSDRAAAHLIHRSCRHPRHLVEHADLREHMVLGIGGVLRIACLVQRGLDDEITRFVGRRRTADAVVALDKKRLASGLRDERRRRQSAKPSADDDDVVAIDSLPVLGAGSRSRAAACAGDADSRTRKTRGRSTGKVQGLISRLPLATAGVPRGTG